MMLTGFAALLLAVTVPFTFFDNRMLVECRINGRGPFTMIVDTGAPDVTITPETARTLSVSVHSAGAVSGAGNKNVSSGTVKIASFSVGPLAFNVREATVLDLSQIKTKFRFPHLDGVVGYPLFEHFAVTVDPDRRTLSFTRRAPAAPDGATTTRFTGFLPEIAAAIDGIPTTVIIDTGDRSSLTLFGPFARKHAFYGRYPSQQHIVTGYGLGGPIYADVFSLPSLDVFGMHLTNVVTRASRQTGGVFALSQQGGSIGEGVLKRFDLVYDYPHKRIIAWPSALRNVADRFVAPGSAQR
ncbi:MAG: retropepsin-like domain-containing protein [Candidatus Eremiobacteraeota bacterium]|nr:retropepsin-like domain-containing protein [Candidatus Eremiobacteraeota bacterium]